MFQLKFDIDQLTVIIHVDIWMKHIVRCFFTQVGQGFTALRTKVTKKSHQPGIPEA